jgi:hypothetical protein
VYARQNTEQWPTVKTKVKLNRPKRSTNRVRVDRHLLRFILIQKWIRRRFVQDLRRTWESLARVRFWEKMKKLTLCKTRELCRLVTSLTRSWACDYTKVTSGTKSWCKLSRRSKTKLKLNKKKNSFFKLDLFKTTMLQNCATVLEIQRILKFTSL